MLAINLLYLFIYYIQVTFLKFNVMDICIDNKLNSKFTVKLIY